MKKAVFCILAICLILCGCKNADQGKKESKDNQQYADVTECKTKKFITDSLVPDNHNVRISYTLPGLSGVEEDKTYMELGMVGDDYYMETKSTEVGHTLIVLKGDMMYSVFHDSKSVVKEKNTEEDVTFYNPVNLLFDVNALDFSGGDISVGEMAFDGVTYYYEEFSVMDQKIRFLYEQDKCKVILVRENDIESVVLVNYYDYDVDMSKFDIPANYKVETYD